MKKLILLTILSIIPFLGYSQMTSKSTNGAKYETIASYPAAWSLKKVSILGVGENYQLYSVTSNRFDDFCLNLGNHSETIAFCDYIIKISEQRGNYFSVEFEDGQEVRIKVMGIGSVMLKSNECVEPAYINLGVFKRIKEKLISNSN